jgi:4-carboxymuconolactone decarboxylase
MPPIPPDRLTPAQRTAAEEIASGRRGGVYGPFVPALRSPELTRRLQALGEYLRYDHALEPRLREMAILLTARAWSQEVEWAIHVPIAFEAGLPPEVVDAIADGRRPPAMRDDEARLHDFVEELLRRHEVGDDTYARAIEAFGEQGVIDLVGAVGYYATLARNMNVARTPPPPGTVPRQRRRPSPAPAPPARDVD